MSNPTLTPDDDTACCHCDAPLAEGEREACARCWVDPNARPVAEELTPEGRAVVDAYAAYVEACADYDVLDERCRVFMAGDGGAERWEAYTQACRERREAFTAAEEAFDRWQAAAKQAA